MSRYFFDLYNGDGPHTDELGVELESRQRVSDEVNRILMDVVRDELAEQSGGQVSVTVRDDSGRAISVANLTFNSRWLDVAG